MKAPPLLSRAHGLCSVTQRDPVDLLSECDVTPLQGAGSGNSRLDSHGVTVPRAHPGQAWGTSAWAPTDSFVFTCPSVSLLLKWGADSLVVAVRTEWAVRSHLSARSSQAPAQSGPDLLSLFCLLQLNLSKKACFIPQNSQRSAQATTLILPQAP